MKAPLAGPRYLAAPRLTALCGRLAGEARHRADGLPGGLGRPCGGAQAAAARSRSDGERPGLDYKTGARRQRRLRGRGQRSTRRLHLPAGPRRDARRQSRADHRRTCEAEAGVTPMKTLRRRVECSAALNPEVIDAVGGGLHDQGEGGARHHHNYASNAHTARPRSLGLCRFAPGPDATRSTSPDRGGPDAFQAVLKSDVRWIFSQVERGVLITRARARCGAREDRRDARRGPQRGAGRYPRERVRLPVLLRATTRARDLHDIPMRARYCRLL